MLRAVGKHSPQLAQAIVECGALEALVICLEDFDPGVKEGAAWALGYIARHNSGNTFGLLSFNLILYESYNKFYYCDVHKSEQKTSFFFLIFCNKTLNLE